MNSNKKIKKKRLFIGIPVSDTLANLLFTVSQKHKGSEGIRWVEKENLHITTCFIGNTPENRIDVIISKTKKALTGISSFTITFEELCITPRKKPYMIWAKFRQNECFEELENKICRLLIPDQKTRKSPIPHITMARFKKSFNPDNIDLNLEIEKQETEVKKLVLWESIQKPDGAEYIPLESFFLNKLI